MRHYKEPYQRGNVIEYNDEMKLEDSQYFTNNTHKPGSDNLAVGERRGTVGCPKRMEEGEEAGGIVDMNDEKVRKKALNDFAEKIYKIVSARVLGKDIKLRLTGQPSLVKQLEHMINIESTYLKGLMMGKAADDPSNQKTREEIRAEANKLDRMLGVQDFWPFK